MTRRLSFWTLLGISVLGGTILIVAAGCSSTDTASGADGGCSGSPPTCQYRDYNSCNYVPGNEFCENGQWTCPHSDPQVCTDCSGHMHIFICDGDSYHCPIDEVECRSDGGADGDTLGDADAAMDDAMSAGDAISD